MQVWGRDGGRECRPDKGGCVWRRTKKSRMQGSVHVNVGCECHAMLEEDGKGLR